MRFDFLHEHDRFIPGWHCRPERASMRAEFAHPEWRWPSRLKRFLANVPSMVFAGRAARPGRALVRRSPRPAEAGSSAVRP